MAKYRCACSRVDKIGWQMAWRASIPAAEPVWQCVGAALCKLIKTTNNPIFFLCLFFSLAFCSNIAQRNANTTLTPRPWMRRPRTKRHWYTRQHTSRTTNATNKTLLARARGRVLTPLVVCVSAIVTFTHVSWRSPCVAPGPVAHATGRRAVTWASARTKASASTVCLSAMARR